MHCPLRCKCHWGRRNSYEWTPGGKLWGRYPQLDVDAGRKRAHATMGMALQRLFLGRRDKPRTQEQKTDRARYMRQWRAKNKPPEPPPKLTRQPLPCGEDCESGCPYDDPAKCPYTDADLDAAQAQADRERRRQQSREKHQREMERRAADADYDRRKREQNRERCRRYYANHPEACRASALKRYHKNKAIRKDGST